MEWFSFADVSWWGVLVAFIACFVLGWLWYSPMAFFPMWSRYGNLRDEDMQNASMGFAFGGAIVGNLLGVILLAMLMPALGATSVFEGLVLGLVLGLIFRGGAHALHNGFALRRPEITLIDTAHDTVTLALAGAILGAF